MKRMVMISVLLSLASCGKTSLPEAKRPNVPALNSPAEAQVWAKGVRGSVTEPAVVDYSTDDRLMTLPLSIPDTTLFVRSEKDSADKATQVSPVRSIPQTKPNVNVNQDWDALGRDFAMQTPNPSVTSRIVVPVQPKKEFAQAELTDFKYVGVLTQNANSRSALGYVKIDERLFPVKAGDAIGRGRWHVISVDAQKMQLQVAGKTMSYERK